MKNNPTQQKVDEMHIDTITLVFGKYGTKSYVPVNPAASIVAVKGGQVKTVSTAIKSALERLGLAKKEDQAEKGAVADGAFSTLMNALYNLEWDIYQVDSAPAIDDVAKKNAVMSLIESFAASAAELIPMAYAEKAQALGEAIKGGTTADVDAINKQIASLDAFASKAKDAGDAYRALIAPKGEETPAATIDDPQQGEKGGETPADEMPAAKPETTAEPVVDDATKAAEAAALDERIAQAVKAAVDAQVTPLQHQVAEANARAEAATADATAAKAAQQKAEADRDAAKASELALARSRSAAGDHHTAEEVKAAKAAAETTDTPAEAPKTILEAVKAARIPAAGAAGALATLHSS